MSTASLAALQLSEGDMLRMDIGRTATLPLLAAAAGLIVVAFMVPFEYTWYRPSYDESEDDIRSEIGAREGSVQRQIALGAVGLLGLASLASQSNTRLRIRGPLGFVCIAYLTWCAATCLWSDNLGMSFRRIVALLCEVLGAMAIAQRASPRQFVWLVFVCTLSWLGLGILAELTQGTLTPWESGYRFKGVFHANIMSANCALLIMSSLYLHWRAKARNPVLLLIAGTALFFLVFTASRTAVGAFVVSMAILPMLRASRPTRLFFTAIAGIVAVSALIVVGLGEFNMDTDWASMGREDHDLMSLTGRVPLWHELIHYISERPFGGYGYGAFWSDVHIADVSRTQGWTVPYAHSTYFDLLLAVGFVGAALCLSAAFLAFFHASRLETRCPQAGFGFISMVIAYTLADGALETNIGSTCFMSFFGICAMCFIVSNYERAFWPLLNGHRSW